MGSSSSVHVSNTFLTAFDFDGEDDGGVPEESDPESESESEESGTFETESVDSREDYTPPKNQFYVHTDFDGFKKNHFGIKEKYANHFNSVKHDINQAISRAKLISTRTLKESGSADVSKKYIINSHLLADMESRGSMENVNQNKKHILDTIDLNVAHQNQAVAFRKKVKGRMALPCATFMDAAPNLYQSSIDHMGTPTAPSSISNNNAAKLEAVADDSATVLEFRRYFALRLRKAERAENRESTWYDKYLPW